MVGKPESLQPFNLENLPEEIIHKVVADMDVMVVWVVEFSREGYKI